VNDVEELGKKKKVEGLSLEELEAQRVELLPAREEMQTVVVAPVAQPTIANLSQLEASSQPVQF
jgi:hypothetical protein